MARSAPSTMAIEHGLVKPKTPGVLRARHAGRPGRPPSTAGRRICRRGAHHQRRPPSCYAEGPDGRVSQAWARSWSTSPMAAISTPSSSRRRTTATLPTIPPATSSPGARWYAPAASTRSIAFVHPENPGINRLSATCSGPASRNMPRRHARNAVFYGDKAIDRCRLRHRHIGAHGAAACQGQAQERATTSSMNRSSARCSSGRVEEGDQRRRTSRPSFPRSAVGRGMTGLNTIFIDDRDPLRAWIRRSADRNNERAARTRGSNTIGHRGAQQSVSSNCF